MFFFSSMAHKSNRLAICFHSIPIQGFSCAQIYVISFSPDLGYLSLFTTYLSCFLFLLDLMNTNCNDRSVCVYLYKSLFFSRYPYEKKEKRRTNRLFSSCAHLCACVGMCARVVDIQRFVYFRPIWKNCNEIPDTKRIEDVLKSFVFIKKHILLISQLVELLEFKYIHLVQEL